MQHASRRACLPPGPHLLHSHLRDATTAVQHLCTLPASLASPPHCSHRRLIHRHPWRWSCCRRSLWPAGCRRHCSSAAAASAAGPPVSAAADGPAACAAMPAMAAPFATARCSRLARFAAICSVVYGVGGLNALCAAAAAVALAKRAAVLAAAVAGVSSGTCFLPAPRPLC